MVSMSFNRRELLNLFGIGASIVPIIGGLPKAEAAARLLEVPKVELAPLSEGDALISSFFQNRRQVFEVDVIIRENGWRIRFQARTFLVKAEREVVACSSPWDIPSRVFSPGTTSSEWALTGACIGEAQVSFSDGVLREGLADPRKCLRD